MRTLVAVRGGFGMVRARTLLFEALVVVAVLVYIGAH
jgi:hypothetical protein